jgi:hypothetical protein
MLDPRFAQEYTGDEKINEKRKASNQQLGREPAEVFQYWAKIIKE